MSCTNFFRLFVNSHDFLNQNFHLAQNLVCSFHDTPPVTFLMVGPYTYGFRLTVVRLYVMVNIYAVPWGQVLVALMLLWGERLVAVVLESMKKKQSTDDYDKQTNKDDDDGT